MMAVWMFRLTLMRILFTRSSLLILNGFKGQSTPILCNCLMTVHAISSPFNLETSLQRKAVWSTPTQPNTVPSAIS